MEKQKTLKEIQRFICICSMFIVAFLFALTDAQKAKATLKGYDSNRCTLQSVTIEVDGTEYVCDGSLKYIPVEYNADWKEVLKTVKIIDYQVLVNDCCSHVKGHDMVEAGLYEETGEDEFNYTKFLTYEDGGENNYSDMDDSLEESYYNVMFCLDGDTDTSIVANFKEECSISYELNGGAFPDGLDVPSVCGVGETINLVSPVNSKGQFEGWMIKQSEEYYPRGAKYRWDGENGPLVFTADWNNESTPVDIGDAEISWDKEVPIHEGGVSTNVVVERNGEELTEGIDYYLSYKNNDKLATKDSDNPPTVTITGIGKYTGSVDKTFSIVENNLEVCQGNYIGHCNLRIVKGKPLSSIDLSDIYVVTSSDYQKVKGTFSWENEEYVPEGEVGDYLNNSYTNNDEKPYNLIFTPDNQEVYCKTTFSYGVDIFVYQGSIADCSVTFAPDQNYQYTGDEIKPEVIVKDGETILEEGCNYKLSYSGYINIADSTDKYAPTVTVEGIGYYLGSQKLTYSIEKKKITPYIATAPAASAITYGQSIDESVLSGGVVWCDESNTTPVEGTFTWKDKTAKPTVADSDKTKYAVVFTPTDTKNYTSVETEITLRVNKAQTAPGKPGSTMNTVYTNDTVGTTATSDDGKATYKVTTASLTKGTVTYVAPTNKKKTTVTIPATVKIGGVTYKVTSIADNAFANNKKITKVTIGSNVTTIGKKAFYKCTKLKKITIPSKVKKIGKQAFYGCKKLKTITIKTTKLTGKNVGSKAFKGIYTKATIKVPKSKLKSYKKLLKAKGVSSKAKIKK